MELKEFNFLLTAAQHNVFLYLKQELAPYDISPSQYSVLRVLWQTGINTPKKIAEKLNLETSTVSGILDRMEKKGLITREVGLRDRREVRITITPAGCRLERPVLDITGRVNDEILRNFSVAEQESLKCLLYSIIDTNYHTLKKAKAES
ncbi:MAG: MarR family winged helix-turn-helix transcriptional regulator [Eubacteriaceae bacterium]|jgi:DNA-binding MarR family transcriptional regulator